MVQLTSLELKSVSYDLPELQLPARWPEWACQCGVTDLLINIPRFQEMLVLFPTSLWHMSSFTLTCQLHCAELWPEEGPGSYIKARTKSLWRRSIKLSGLINLESKQTARSKVRHIF